MKYVYLLVVLMPLVAICDYVNPLRFSGQTEYVQSNSKSLDTEIAAEYKLFFYQPLHKKWASYLGGKVTMDYNVFGGTLKTNTFTTIGVDF